MLAIADDLSGAGEVAVALGLPGRIVLGPAPGGPPPGPGEAVVHDLDTRRLPGAAAADAVRAVLKDTGPDALVFKKVDSQLRGNFAAEAAAFAEGAPGPVVATALPPLGRTVRGGVVHLDGVPLHETDGWRAERADPPRSVAEALGDLPTRVVPLDAVRGPGLAALLAELTDGGAVPLCDAETAADLDAVAAAACACGPGMRLLGTAGLGAAVCRMLAPPNPAPVPAVCPAPGGRPLLMVVGTAEPAAGAQIAALAALGARHVALSADALASGTALVPALAPGGITVLSIDAPAGIVPGAARALVTGLARAVAAVPVPADLVLTGGETARRVLDALGVAELAPHGQIHHGAVHATAPDGRSVVTRPGSYGGPDSLLTIARALRPVPSGEAV
ncbi:four-carbon acid sugar kinase family protein [Streptomyces sp. 8L]|uniref:four-carbon acid sugar kinase family protein n=1 Tax=Streptomyces sp. 8L TaxID=2877242 RepID=UPI001CD25D18|nr:four-carbon acid sugar kinase family protein [Streptomyces sp. 8L]MCA1216854.1 4-hydroxythreonine-4-phosphate dehydrogenase [Streptomyces sp. 8L]